MSSFESLSASHRFKFKNRGTTKPSHDVDLYVYQVRSRRSLPIKSLRVHKNGSKCQKLRVSLRYAYFDPALRAGSKSAPLQTNIMRFEKYKKLCHKFRILMVKNFLIKNSPMKDEFCELQNYGNSLLVFGLESGSALTKAIADWTDS